MWEPRWKRWKTAFQFVIDGKGVTDPKQENLHSAEMSVPEEYLTLQEPASGRKDEAESFYTPRLICTVRATRIHPSG